MTYTNLGNFSAEVLAVGAAGSESPITATPAEINAACDISARIVNITGSSVTIVAATHANRILTLNKSDGLAITMLAASGTGNRYEFIVGTTVASSAITIIGLTNAATYVGQIVSNDDGSASTCINWAATAGDNLVTLNGSTQGGIKGDRFIFTDIGTNLYHILGTTESSGTEATPFSTAS